MKSVLFQNPNAVFNFELSDVIEGLKHYSEQGVHEANEIFEAISLTSSSTIEVTTEYFAYVSLDLLKTGKGHAYCKTCKEIYNPGQLRSIPLGFGKSPFSIDIKPEGGIIKRIFGRKSLICGEGGTAYECPKGHELISAITWTGMLRCLERYLI